MYTKILNEVVLCLFNKNQEMTLYDFLIHIYLYLLFFYENSSLDINSVDSYNKLITVFIPFIKLKFNYKLNAISNDKYQSLIDKNNINDIFVTKTKTTKNNFNDIIYDIFKTIKELKIYSKEMKSLFTKQNVIEYINKLYNDYIINSKITNTINDKLVLNLFSGSGNLINCLIDNSDYSDKFNSSNITLCDNNEFMNIIAYANLKMNTGSEFLNIIKTDILHDNNINSEYDVIISDLPDDIRNIIHANCCNRIKQFKIRGTKSEPLILQLVMSLLNQNGIAFIIVPDSMLFSDSNQHIETRKYLLENFKLEKVINIEDKKSILMFTNNGKTSSIQFLSMLNDYNLTVNIDIIKTKNYSFYYYNYENNINIPIKNNLNNDKCQKLGQIINILNTFPKTNNSELAEYLVCYKTNLFKIMKTSDTTNTINLTKLTKTTEVDYVFEVNNKDQYSQNYINYYLLNLFNKNLNNISKGKIKQLDIDVIKNLNIYIPQYSLQIEIINTIEYNNKIIELNKIQINNYEQLKLNYLSNIISSISTEKLVNMCKISHDSVSSNTIVINRNSNMAGTVGLTVLDNESTTNNYYLEPDTTQINNICLYYILKMYESKLKEMSKANNTINLARTKLENIEIPILSSKDSILIEKCVIFDNKIKQLIIMNEQLEIMSLF